MSLWDIFFWAAGLVFSPAKDGTGTPTLLLSWPVGRVNGGFMIMRSTLLADSSNAVSSSRTPPSCPARRVDACPISEPV